jgi:hypothetical protein
MLENNTDKSLPIFIDKVYRAQMNSLSVPYYHMKLLAGLIRS